MYIQIVHILPITSPTLAIHAIEPMPKSKTRRIGIQFTVSFGKMAFPNKPQQIMRLANGV